MFPTPSQNMSVYMKLLSIELWVNALTQNGIYYPYAEPTQSHIPLRTVKATIPVVTLLVWLMQKKHEHKYIMLVLLIRIYRLNEISKTCNAFGIALCCVRPSLLHGKLTYLFLFTPVAVCWLQHMQMSGAHSLLYCTGLFHAQSCNRPIQSMPFSFSMSLRPSP